MAEADLRWMRTVVVVAEEGSLRAAARRLSLSQPAVSQQVRALERALGVSVLERDRRGARLTDAGRDLVAAVAQVEQAMERLGAAMAEHRDRGPVRLGVPANLPPGLVAGAVAALRRDHPQVRVDLHGGPTAEQGPALLAGTVDVALLRSRPATEHRRSLGWVELLHEPVGVALAVDHPAAGLAMVPAATVRSATLFRVSAHHVPGRPGGALAAAGLEDPGDRGAGPDLATSLAMAAAGQGMVITTERQVGAHHPEALVWRPIEGVDDHHVTWVVWRRTDVLLVRELVGHLRRVAAHRGAPAG